MYLKARTLLFFYAKKLKIVQNQEKSLWCILKCCYVFVYFTFYSNTSVQMRIALAYRNFRLKNGLVSQKVRHDKDTSLLQDRTRRAYV